MEQNSDKNGKIAPPGVAIDGTAIKSLREAKKLTQLYVANVVGVTTDTISRWENNRYPSIKRDNAEKLAAALEVTLDDILRREELEPVAAEPGPTPTGKHHGILLLLIIVVILIGVFIARQTAITPTAVRWLPHFAAPGEVIPVQIKLLRRDPGTGGIIVREQLPPGWQLLRANPVPSVGEKPDSEVKWLIPGNSGPTTISYTVRIPKDLHLGTTQVLSGKIVLQRNDTTRTETIGGSSKITVNGRHWADSNGDGKIDDNEIMPAYYLTEEMKGFDINWKSIETIWNSKGYTWNIDRQEFMVNR